MARSTLLLVVLAACGGATRPAAQEPVSSHATPPPPPPPAPVVAAVVASGPVLATDPRFTVELGKVGPCVAQAPCEVELVLRALGKYHVNAEYPTKFVSTDGVSGRFAVMNETTGVM